MLLGPTVGPQGRRLETSRIHAVRFEDPVATNRRVPAEMGPGASIWHGFPFRGS